MENVAEKILGLLNQAQELIQSAKEAYTVSISEPAPENLGEPDVATPAETETPVAVTEPVAEVEPSTVEEPEAPMTAGEGSEIGAQE